MNGVKSRPTEPIRDETGPQVSGKLVIIVVLAVAVTGAAVSWYFRYNATHRAAEFWGPEAAVLIRDAPHVALLVLQPANGQKTPNDLLETVMLGGQTYRIALHQDISHAHGLVHLRNALIEDHSFIWPQRDAAAEIDWHWGLQFADGGPKSNGQSVGTTRTIWFTSDCKLMMRDERGEGPQVTISSEPIAAGLREMFAELSAKPASDSADQSR